MQITKQQEDNALVAAYLKNYQARQAKKQRQERAEAAKAAKASIELEGFNLTPADEVQVQAYIEGRMTLDQLLEALLK